MCDSRFVTRLFRLLLALLLALPAAQAASHLPDTHPGHAKMLHDMTGHHHGHDVPVPAGTSHHDCIGCIAPLDIRLYRPVSTPTLETALDERPADMAFLLVRNAAPEPPPPRATV
ncbi:MAG TPA: hypothetical protein VGE65_05095 [Sphingobium sp.]